MAADIVNEVADRNSGDGIAWHSLAEEVVLEKLCSTRGGLEASKVAERQQEFGPNRLPARRPPTLLGILLHQFRSPLIYILLAAAVVSMLLAEFTDAAFIFVVLLLNAGLGMFQEWRAERSAAALQELIQTQARVRRAGREAIIPAKDIVPGDIVLVESGDRVPADLRLLQAANLAIDESFLTGETIAPEKSVAPVAEDAPIGDRLNLAFAGSTVQTGRGLGVTVATGIATQVGRIAVSVAFAEAAKPPLLLRMEKFAQQISYFVGAAIILLAAIGVYRNMSILDVFFFAVALAVSAIPEGLPVAMTVALSIGVQRMARRNVIVRKLPAVEGLGSCTVIASDKTGTLTVNQQTVRALWLPAHGRLMVPGGSYPGAEAEEPVLPGPAAQVEALARASALCNEARLERLEGGWQGHGDAMDVALLVLAHKARLDPEAARGEVQPLGEIPYESERKYAAVFYRRGAEARVALKGAVETVLGFCERMRTPAGDVPLDADRVTLEAESLAGDGFRVLAIAEGGLDGTPPGRTDFGEADLPRLVLLGLAAFLDPLRPEAKAAVATCREAGIEVVMVTGDHPATALSIARELGIAQGPGQVVTGRRLAEIGSTETPEFFETVTRGRVFARVSPLQKLDIVDGLVRAGQFVAVTGDGVNDAPALKKANIGVAMGSGTDVAKDTASIIVTDDNFASIVAGVEEGRFAYDNIRKVSYLLISCGLAEVLLFAGTLLAGLPLPLLPVQLLWLNLVTNGIQDVALAFEAGEPGAMKRPPRKPTEGIFNRLMIQQMIASGTTMALLAFGTWYWLMERQGLGEFEARNLTLMLMVLLENVHAFNCRSEYDSVLHVPLSRNRLLVVGVIAAHALHIGCMYQPGMAAVLGLAPISFGSWIILLAMALSLLVVMEVFKLIRRSPGIP